MKENVIYEIWRVSSQRHVIYGGAGRAGGGACSMERTCWKEERQAPSNPTRIPALTRWHPTRIPSPKHWPPTPALSYLTRISASNFILQYSVLVVFMNEYSRSWWLSCTFSRGVVDSISKHEPTRIPSNMTQILAPSHLTRIPAPSHTTQIPAPLHPTRLPAFSQPLWYRLLQTRLRYRLCHI